MSEGYWEKCIATRWWVTIMFSTIELRYCVTRGSESGFDCRRATLRTVHRFPVQNRNEIAALTYGDSIRPCCIEEELFSPRSILGAQQFRRRAQKIAARRLSSPPPPPRRLQQFECSSMQQQCHVSLTWQFRFCVIKSITIWKSFTLFMILRNERHPENLYSC